MRRILRPRDDMTFRFACSHNMRVIHDNISYIRCDSMTFEWFAA